MAGVAHGLLIPDLNGARLLIIEARYHAEINDRLLKGAQAMLQKASARWEKLTVPGALEIPTAIKCALGHYDGFVGLGCVIRGETTHYDLVAFESCRGLMSLGTQTGAAIGNGILTVESPEQAIVRADPEQMDKGGHAALAALTLVAWQRQLVSDR